MMAAKFITININGTEEMVLKRCEVYKYDIPFQYCNGVVIYAKMLMPLPCTKCDSLHTEFVPLCKKADLIWRWDSIICNNPFHYCIGIHYLPKILILFLCTKCDHILLIVSLPYYKLKCCIANIFALLLKIYQIKHTGQNTFHCFRFIEYFSKKLLPFSWCKRCYDYIFKCLDMGIFNFKCNASLIIREYTLN